MNILLSNPVFLPVMVILAAELVLSLLAVIAFGVMRFPQPRLKLILTIINGVGTIIMVLVFMTRMQPPAPHP